ncbi:Flagella basal body rod protein [Desulfotomaculum arcticum]|uniref:Flagellar hook protein FlgE n=1 Tax=Desulfotruncus arcticus DSM 17038 TaxID=1121424 RepID=A0A1I2MWN4_9FIRM|nr:flagellar hook-basal body complex protein [Desulfotruncus arcticus]SFF96005.1 Flagella basal body rod protein [Desulfotomaculum arcticum] [Desulfotruncus arcticus DSM 17038]
MIRSLYSGVSGLKNHQLRMDVVGNNISNVNTLGYKAGVANFQDALSQTISSGGNGRNPAQIGTGMLTGSVVNDFTQGATQSTGRSLDLAINGNGFFVVKDVETGNEYYTRAGVFYLDNQGYLVNSDGLRVQSSSGDIRVYNGPASTISISADGSITGTNEMGEPLQFTSTPVTIPAPTPVEEAVLNGDYMGEIQPLVSATGSLTGDAIAAVEKELEEAIVKGNSDSAKVEPKLATSETVNMTDETNYDFQLVYNDGNGNTYTVDLNDSLSSVSGWYDLADQLQAAIDNDPDVAGKVKVSYDDSAYGGLVFETITDPGATDTSGNPVAPTFTLTGDGVAKYMGLDDGATQLTDQVTAVQPKDWTGKTFTFYLGNKGWQEVKLKEDFADFGYSTTDTGFSSVTSGQDLADKLQQLLNVMAGDDPTTANVESEANVSVIWDNDHLVFKPYPEDAGKTVTLGGADVADFIGTGSAATESNIDWIDKDITINYNGTSYSFSATEKQQAGLGSITSGVALAQALNNLIDTKIGSDKVDVTWSTDHLVFTTKDTTGIGNQPSITIGGADAADFVGATTSATGTASKESDVPSQAPYNVIRLVSFSNPEGLIKVGSNVYECSAETSGLPENDTVSAIESGRVEMSNVDLTDEFADMITTQRGYQANSRIITVSDTMLEELMNLKR